MPAATAEPVRRPKEKIISHQMPELVQESATAKNDDVSRPTARYEELMVLRALPRALMGGTRAMRAAGKEYMPQHPAESDDVFASRLRSTTLYGAFAETVGSQASKFFTKPVQLKQAEKKKDGSQGDTDGVVDDALVELCDNIDGQGRALTPFMLDCVKDGFVDGISYIFVDMPALAPAATLKDQRDQKARPYWVMVNAGNVIGMRTQAQGGSQQLVQVRIRECTSEPDGLFGEVEKTRIRVLEPGKWSLYLKTKNSRGETVWVPDGEGTTSLPYVPLVPVYINRSAFMEGQPPLSTLADLCQEHWVSSSEHRRALTFMRFAMLCLTGIEDTKPIEVGPDKVIRIPNPNGDAKYVEHSGAGIDSGMKDLEAIEKRMQGAGMELRVENAGEVTATASAIDSEESNAGLMAVAKALKDAIETALQYTADYLKIEEGGEVNVYNEFGSTEIAGTLPELLSLRTAKEISQATFWQELKRRHILAEDFDPEEESELLEADAEKDMERMAETMKLMGPPGGEGGDPPPGGPPKAPPINLPKE